MLNSISYYLNINGFLAISNATPLLFKMAFYIDKDFIKKELTVNVDKLKFPVYLRIRGYPGELKNEGYP